MERLLVPDAPRSQVLVIILPLEKSPFLGCTPLVSVCSSCSFGGSKLGYAYFT